MKFEKKEVLKAFLPILMDILKGILAYLRSHRNSGAWEKAKRS